ncbi:helix-turn-helix domain-containing protein [Enterococcus faecium]|nr:helix-turn-helix domain-containing protein [Enterococcus faecium]
MRELQLRFMLNKRTISWLKMLNYFERERELSVVSLVTILGITRRTLMNDLDNLMIYFEDTMVIMNVPNGYYFKETNPSLFLERKSELVIKERLYQVLESIFHGNPKSIDKWADQFYVSESTMRRSLVSVIPILEKYGLALSFQPVDFIGEEANMRKFFKDFYYEGDITPHTLFPPESLKDIVNDAFADTPLIMDNTGAAPGDFYYSLYIMIQRFKIGKRIKVPSVLKNIVESIPEFNVFITLGKKSMNTITFCHLQQSLFGFF